MINLSLETLLNQELARYGWPFLRIAGLAMVAPVFGSRTVSPRVRIALCLTLTALVAPSLPPPPDIPPFSLAGFLVAAQEVLIGAAMGFVVQMVFDALVIGGQTVAMTMGLGFAMLVDPQRGVSVPVLSQFLIVLGILIFLALDAHLLLLQLLVDSFRWVSVGQGIAGDGYWALLNWGSGMFNGALTIALPAVVALLVVNFAFGVMSRAAPTLNLFAVGFPAALLLGFLILWLNTPNLLPGLQGLVEGSLATVETMLRS